MNPEEHERTVDEQAASQETPSTTEAAVMQQALEEQSKLAAEYLDQWRRTAADFANYRKRQERDYEQMRLWATADLLTNLLPVLDDLERAVNHLPTDDANADWAEGVKLIQRKLQNVLQGTGLTEIVAEAGQPFDPTCQEAVMYEATDTYPEGYIIERLRRGYRLGDRILRPALVRVSKAAA